MNGERIVFRCKPIMGRFSPMATIGLYLNERWHRLDAYVDSGASCFVIHADLARDIGVDFESGRRISVKEGMGA